jgi:hypothetical protein
LIIFYLFHLVPQKQIGFSEQKKDRKSKIEKLCFGEIRNNLGKSRKSFELKERAEPGEVLLFLVNESDLQKLLG